MENKGRNGGTLHSFQAGQSGNPSGRPKGSRNIATMLREMLAAKDKKTGEYGSPVAEELMKIAFDAKVSPETRLKALKEIIDRIEGQPEQKLNLSGDRPFSWFD